MLVGFRSLLALTLTVAVIATKKRYDGYKLISVKAETDEQVKGIRALEALPEVTFWTQPNTHLPTDISVPPSLVSKVISALEALGLKPKINIEDMQKLIDGEMKQNVYAQQASTSFRFGADNLARVKGYFMRVGEINQWMDEIAAKFSNVKLVSIGRSYEGRDMKALIIGSGNKPGIFIDSGIHAREWISVSTNLFMIYELLAGYKSGATTALLDKYDWYFVPVANPDGYEYTHTKNRMWRKNRRPMYMCIGADPNRNFDINFGGTGTSKNPCTDIYHGPRAFSEPCARNLAKFLMQLNSSKKTKLVAYMSLHAYSQMWFMPYAFDKYRRPHDYEELLRVARIGAQAIYNTHGKIYTVGSPGEILYEAAGSTMDWVKAKTQIKYSYAMEMRPDGNTVNPPGFIVPPSEIIPAGEEMLAGIRAMAANMVV